MEVEQSLGRIYRESEVCLPTRRECLKMEPGLEALMRTCRDPEELLSAWQGWRRAVSSPSRPLYPQLIRLQNAAARNNGKS
jgi:hypothetical protein